MSRVVIYAYKATSRSARKIQEYLDEQDVSTLLIYPGKAYTPRSTDKILGWGAGDWPDWKRRAEDSGCAWLNRSDAIMRSIDKRETFNALRATHNIHMPVHTENANTAKVWLRDGFTVLARVSTQGKDGEGLVVMDSPDAFVQANLYTLYEEKTDEFRVHVWDGRAFWGQIREPITDRESKYYRRNPDNRIRTSSNGWTLYVYNIDMPERCARVAERAIQALGLDFGAVDIGWNRDTRVATVYETNTSPELSDRTCGAYVQQILTTLQ